MGRAPLTRGFCDLFQGSRVGEQQGGEVGGQSDTPAPAIFSDSFS